MSNEREFRLDSNVQEYILNFFVKYSPFPILATPVFGNISSRFWQHKKKLFRIYFLTPCFLQNDARTFFIMNKLCPGRPVAGSKGPGESGHFEKWSEPYQYGYQTSWFFKTMPANTFLGTKNALATL